MLSKINIRSKVQIFTINAIGVFVVVSLQFLFYATAPAIDPNAAYKDNFDKRAACIQATIHFNKILIAELLIAAAIISIINYFNFRRTSQRPTFLTLLFLFGFIILTGVSLTYFSFDYVARNVGK